MDFIETHSVKKIEATEKENLNKEKIEEKMNLSPKKESFDCKKPTIQKPKKQENFLLKRKIIRSILKRKLTLTQIPPKIGFEKDSSIEITQNKFGYEENTEPNGEDNQELFPLIKRPMNNFLSFPITKNINGKRLFWIMEFFKYKLIKFMRK
ncbi:hypothetical protein M0811_10374 [Anaeramoeba ignava]|uniref:Uncharacterized protein n=1 Tax=Anaeramoeba ignava TaxID=1746090 RepID=A0A9Q0LEB7_ANAIG|nr:hypothetical protein M0811_10374 [Anaeramoeba ignava]